MMRAINSYKYFILTYLLNLCVGNDLYSDRVRKYDSESFKVNVGGSIPHFVNFFAPWCGYCKRLKPVWDELAEKYNVDSPSQKIVIAKVDCTTETPLCAEENIAGYPSLMFYNAGSTKGKKYGGKRDLEGLQVFITESLQETSTPPKTSPVQNTPEQHAVELTDETIHSTVDFGFHFVKFYAPWCGHCIKMAKAWEELAQDFADDKFVTISSVDCTRNKRACQEFEIKGFPTLLWIVDGKKVKKYEGGRNLDDFKNFISQMKEAPKERLESEEGRIPDAIPNAASDHTAPKQKLPETYAVELTDETFHDTISFGFHFVKFYAPWCGHCIRMAEAWEELAQNSAEDKSVTISSVDCTKHRKACEEFDIKGFPTLLWIFDGKKVKKYEGGRNLDDFKSFISQMKQAQKERLENEGSIPDAIPDGLDLVVELVTDNFENAIEKGFTFVKFYVPWCGHSKRLAPVWNELSVKLVQNPEVKIAKLDCIKNDKICEKYKILGYPSLVLFRNGKYLKEYSGQRTLEKIHNFLDEHLHHTEL